MADLPSGPAGDAHAGAFRPCGIVTLTTDFGTSDAYAGALKGSILRVAPELRVHDISHSIAPQDVGHGARVLRGACPWFPPGTVHLAVVDPGVGTERAPIALVVSGHAFVGPDNGVFAEVVRALGGRAAARRIDERGALERFLPDRRSRTFHGRDLFAPAAAALASARLGFEEIGPEHGLATPREGRPARLLSAETPVARVTHCDAFGNAVTDATEADLRALGRPVRSVRLPDGRRVPLLGTYGDAPAGSPLALLGSEGFLEIAVSGGSARQQLGLQPGSELRLETEP